MEKAPSVTGGAQRKIPVRDVQRTRNLSVHPLKVDSMNELQSIVARLKTPIAIIQDCGMRRRPVRMAKHAHEGHLAADKQTGRRPSVCQFTIAV